MSYTTYSEYINSDIDCTPQMPSHWKVGKVKFVTENLDKLRIPLSAEERSYRQGSYPYYGASGIIDYVNDYLFDEDTILFGEDGANLFARSTPLAFLANGKYWVNNHAHILKPKDGINRYWVMCFENIDVTPVVSGSAQPKLTAEELGNLEIVYPPTVLEKKQIAAFLDHETAKIDTLIEKQQQLIKLLKEKRQGGISHAVTKGLNLDAPMRDSGVEWLGEVPEHWGLTQIKRIAELTPKKSEVEKEKQKQCNFVPMEKLKTDSLVLDEIRLISDVYDGYTYFKDEDILMAKVTPCFENKNIAIAKDMINGIGFGSSEIYVLRTNKTVVNSFLYYRLQEDSFMEIATAAMTGAGGLRRVPSDVVNDFNIALPPIKEQETIVNYIKKYSTKFDVLVINANKAINLLKERRTALIFTSVTGKIDVSNWQPQIQNQNKKENIL